MDTGLPKKRLLANLLPSNLSEVYSDEYQLSNIPYELKKACDTWFDQDLVRPHLGDMVRPEIVMRTWFDQECNSYQIAHE